ncbi:TSUP family transporter [Streptomyces mirabilis]|uniref:Probable membrane transporter protein n=1 Tax=Streptomyces mirabilis TaxID=68239 RepID=A0A1I2DTW4_9ACTN|nr:TSUP family transporter [Streptomyces mirabilis]SFE83703.1 Sulfite exporter TauE/SafE [Streptomyces mirabilis]
MRTLILLALGLYVMSRFTFRGMPKGQLGKPLRKRFLAPLGLVAGFLDATGGGGWGPVGTPALLAGGRMEPRKVIGSIDTSEFLVAIAAGLGFLFSLGSPGAELDLGPRLPPLRPRPRPPVRAVGRGPDVLDPRVPEGEDGGGRGGGPAAGGGLKNGRGGWVRRAWPPRGR